MVTILLWIYLLYQTANGWFLFLFIADFIGMFVALLLTLTVKKAQELNVDVSKRKNDEGQANDKANQILRLLSGWNFVFAVVISGLPSLIGVYLVILYCLVAGICSKVAQLASSLKWLIVDTWSLIQDFRSAQKGSSNPNNGWEEQFWVSDSYNTGHLLEDEQATTIKRWLDEGYEDDEYDEEYDGDDFSLRSTKER